jgi:hypothetical protein
VTQIETLIATQSPGIAIAPSPMTVNQQSPGIAIAPSPMIVNQ